MGEIGEVGTAKKAAEEKKMKRINRRNNQQFEIDALYFIVFVQGIAQICLGIVLLIK